MLLKFSEIYFDKKFDIVGFDIPLRTASYVLSLNGHIFVLKDTRDLNTIQELAIDRLNFDMNRKRQLEVEAMATEEKITINNRDLLSEVVSLRLMEKAGLTSL